MKHDAIPARAMIAAALALLLLSAGCDTSAGEANDSEEATVKIQLSAGDTVWTATLLDTEPGHAFLAMLPLTLTLRDYAGTEKVSDLPEKLPTTGAPDGYQPAAGDITYYAPWGNLAIFYRDFGYASGLVKLGRFDTGIEQLAGMKDSFEVVIERDELAD